MTKPVGYYCSVTPGDGSLLDELQEEFGSTFEGLTKLQKLQILNTLINNLTDAHIKTISSRAATEEANAVTPVINQIKQNLSIGEHLSWADAIVNQLKCQRRSQR